MNRPDARGKAGVNQLSLLHQLGLLAGTPDPAKLPRLFDPYDESADLDRRARSYLQTNCAHCHQYSAGGIGNIDLGYDLPLEATNTVGIRPIQGTFNIAGASIISPGDPAGSVLFYRVSKLGGGRMPRAGSSQVDERATRMIHDWIASMPKAKSGDAAAKVAPEDRAALESLRQSDRLSPDARSAAMQRLASTTRGALMLLGLIDRSPAASFIAARRRGDRPQQPSGRGPRPVRAICSRRRAGQAAGRRDRPGGHPGLGGRRRAGASGLHDQSCRAMQDLSPGRRVGETVGPDLTKIGAKYNKSVLDQILEPSKTIDPQFVTHLLETKDGRT